MHAFSPLSCNSCLSWLATLLLISTATATEFELNGHKFTVPEGFQVEHVAGQPLVARPVSADFDERGRLYVTDSSGSNEHVDVQREKRPHRIRRLEDTDGDGVFDKSTIYADKLMFPEGSQWFDGSLYVAAPPEIWKFTDADDDGVAEKREVWFDGKTLTHCANDLHGPYLGPDGWMYWCKGAFAKQTYERPGRKPWETKAAHIFRRRPEGGPIEPVMTGGMDNPVEVVFSPGGERFFTTTFIVHPNQGNRDGLLHAVYGGAYGKDHQALGSHPRTGELMPVLAHLGAAAPCGLARLDSEGLGEGYRNNILACLFNMHKITRHVLTKQGATFTSDTSDLLVSDNLDFHPTDVLEDADGSVLVVDTGGWFRLCCPTSQLEKADVLGGIYRIRRTDAKMMDDPRGGAIAWDNASDDQLAELLNDERFAVRNQAEHRIGHRGARAIDSLQQVLSSSNDPHHRLQVVWALTWIEGERSRELVRTALDDSDETVRQAALHSISLRKDRAATDQLTLMINHGPAHNRRAAAEALGRVGSSDDIAKLLAAVPNAMRDGGDNEATVDRFLEHSLTYAAMELNDPNTLRQFIGDDNPRIRRAALIALDQMEEGDHLLSTDVRPLLVSRDELLNETAWWIAKQHPDWGDAVVNAFRLELQKPTPDEKLLERLGDRLQQFAGASSVQQVMADALSDPKTNESLQLMLLDAMANSGQKPLPAAWAAPLQKQLFGTVSGIRTAVTVLNRLSDGKLDDKTTVRLKSIANDERTDADVRLLALASLPAGTRDMDPNILKFVGSQLDIESSVTNRALAVDVITSTRLGSEQLSAVARELPRTGVMELQPLMTMFAKSSDVRVGMALVTALLKSPAATSLFPDRLRDQLAGFGDAVAVKAEPLLEKIKLENQSKLQRVEDVLALLPDADVRRGLRVFQSTKASCIACHRRGYIGGSIGPDLNRIGQVRKERDLLESILFPSLTFVRNYEPVSIVTSDGRIFSGVIREETDDSIELQLDAQKTIRIDKSTIDERQSGTISIMPAGLEKQLSPQEFADLVKYLKES
ncbi:MAG: HEAT repeat domain-containing protein [Planctomycetes bacterium]|nr:HEAT repeat domain-containing protein [Planctomycetota bacterium]